MLFNTQIAARTLWQEARGEPVEGQRAVAHVLVNRLHSGRWGAALGEVCLSEFKGIYQFSGWSRTDPNRKAAFALADDDAHLIALGALIQAALAGEADPTCGALFYYATSIPAPGWAATMHPLGQFGHQLFFTDRTTNTGTMV